MRIGGYMIVGAAYLLAGSCGPAQVAQPLENDAASLNAATYIDPALVPGLRDQAEVACHCARGKPTTERDACWASFHAEIARYRQSIWASACGPASSEYIEFETEAGAGSGIAPDDMIIYLDHGYGACSAEELPLRRAAYETEHGDEGC